MKNILKMQVYGRPDHGIDRQSVMELLASKNDEEVRELSQGMSLYMRQHIMDKSAAEGEEAKMQAAFQLLQYLNTDSRVVPHETRRAEQVVQQYKTLEVLATASDPNKQNPLEYRVVVAPEDLLLCLSQDARIKNTPLEDSLIELIDYTPAPIKPAPKVRF